MQGGVLGGGAFGGVIPEADTYHLARIPRSERNDILDNIVGKYRLFSSGLEGCPSVVLGF